MTKSVQVFLEGIIKKSTTYAREGSLLWSPPSAVHRIDALDCDPYISWLLIVHEYMKIYLSDVTKYRRIVTVRLTT